MNPRLSMASSLPLSAACALLCAAVVAPSHADVLVDNLGEPIRNPAHVGNDFWSAQSFITAGGGALRLDAVTLRLGVLHDAPSIRAELHADSGGSPGSLLASFGLPLLDGGPTHNAVLAVPSGLMLQPATSYWLVLGVDGAGGLDWSYAAGNAASGSGSFGDYAFSLTQGLSWTGFGLEDPYMARIEVSPVPEPSAAMLAPMGLLVLAWLARRRATAQVDAA